MTARALPPARLPRVAARRRGAAPLLIAALLWTGPAAGASPDLREDPGWSPPRVGTPARAFRLRSDILDEERRIFVSLPSSHALTTRPYPVLLVFDGESLLPAVATAAAVLAESGQAPEAVIVAIENTDRLRDLSPPGAPVSGNDGAGRADLFADFLDRELLPALAAKFRAGDPVTLVGHSSGGLFVHYAGATRSDRFSSLLALDSPMHLDGSTTPWLDLARSPAAAARLKLVTLETVFGWPEATWQELTAAAPDGWLLHRETIPGETHQSMVWLGSYLGLKRLFGEYSAIGDEPPRTKLTRFDTRFGESASLPPPRVVLERAVEDEIATRQIELAARFLQRLAAAYGETTTVTKLRQQISAVGSDELEGPSLEELLATPPARADSIPGLPGRWQGHSWIEGQDKRSELSLEVFVQDGILSGRFNFPQGPGHEVEYFASVGDEVHVGYLNRMRPRGMLMYEGTLFGDVFEGRFVLRGVVFRTPDGRELPQMRFRLERTGR